MGYCIIYPMFNNNNERYKMDNHSEIANQYGKLNALYSTIIFLQKEIKKEQDKLEQLKKKEEK